MLKLKKKKIPLLDRVTIDQMIMRAENSLKWYILTTFYKTPVLKGPVTILV